MTTIARGIVLEHHRTAVGTVRKVERRSDALTAEELASLTSIEVSPSEDAHAMRTAERAARRSHRKGRRL